MGFLGAAAFNARQTVSYDPSRKPELIDKVFKAFGDGDGIIQLGRDHRLDLVWLVFPICIGITAFTLRRRWLSVHAGRVDKTSNG